MTTEDQLIVLFCLIDGWVRAHPPPPRPGPASACADSEVLTLAVGRELLGGRSERGFLRRLRRDWRHLFPRLPAQSELNRRTRWLQGALEPLRRHLAAQLPSATSTLVGVDTSPLPVKHRTRVRRRRGATFDGPNDRAADFGYRAAKREWFYGFRLAALAPLADGVPRHWALCPASVDERDVAAELLRGESGLLLVADRGFDGAAMRDRLARQHGLLLTPPRKRRRYQPSPLAREFVRRRRNRCERPFQALQERFALNDHRARTLWGLLTRLTAKAERRGLGRPGRGRGSWISGVGGVRRAAVCADFGRPALGASLCGTGHTERRRAVSGARQAEATGGDDILLDLVRAAADRGGGTPEVAIFDCTVQGRT